MKTKMLAVLALVLSFASAPRAHAVEPVTVVLGTTAAYSTVLLMGLDCFRGNTITCKLAISTMAPSVGTSDRNGARRALGEMIAQDAAVYLADESQMTPVLAAALKNAQASLSEKGAAASERELAQAFVDLN